jgi:hypothetical protein
MRKSHLIYAIFLLAVFAAVNACTSSSTNVRTNPSYDTDYTNQTRSRQTASGQGDSQYPQEVYHPPITLEMVAMNTGEALKGEAYPIIAVVDNPEKRQLTYKWSVEAGTITKLPESMRAEALSWEQQLVAAKGLPGAKPVEGALPESAAGEAAPTAASPMTPPAGPPAIIPPGGKPAEGVAIPGGQQPVAPVTPVPPPVDKPNPAATSQPQAQSPAQTAMAAMRYALLGPDEEAKEGEQAWPDPKAKAGEATAADTAAETPVTDDPNKDAAAQAKGVDKQIEAIAGDAAAAGEAGFKPEATEGKLVEVPADKEKGADGEDLLAETPPMVTITTDQPYILWTPPDLGAYNVHCQVVDNKGNELTPDRAFPVTVTEPRPKVELAWNKTEKLHEEDFLVVEIRAKNITGYNKGLFTMDFDPTKLSFRTAEQGAFFPKDAKTSIYYAELPNAPGKVTLAIAVDQLDLPQGDGVVARVIFKVKENVDDPSTLNITQETAEEARYILDADGKNILPAVDTSPIFATEWSEPPAPPTQDRPDTTQGTAQLPATPAPPAAGQTERDKLMEQSKQRAMQASQSGTSGVTGATGSAGNEQQQAASNPQLQALQAQRQTIMQDTTLSPDDRLSRLQAIDAQIAAILGVSK